MKSYTWIINWPSFRKLSIVNDPELKDGRVFIRDLNDKQTE
jgi:hypothetical protein